MAYLGDTAPDAGTQRPEISVKTIRERYLAGRRESTLLQHNYWLNASYLLGEQWLWVNPTANQIETLPIEPDRVRATINHMLPFSRTLISKLNSKPLKFAVPPTKADDGTLRAARTAESILAGLARDQDWESLREDAAWAAWKGGVAAISLTWDTSKGTQLGFTDDGRSFGTGDISPRVHSIVDFAVQPGVRNAETAAWWIDAVVLPPETVQDFYDLETLPAADASAGMSPFQRSLFESHITGENRTGAPGINLTLVLIYYERPSRSNPKGKVCHVVGSEIVREGPWPFPFKDRLNLVIMKETRVDNKWWGVTVLTSGRSVQNGINQSWSSIIEHMKLAGNARLYVPQSSYEIMRLSTDTPGEMIPWPDGMPTPAYVGPTQMPQWTIEQPQRLKEELADILGAHDVSRGEAPNNIQSGLGLSILVEQDQTPVGRMIKEQAGAWGRFASMVLAIYESKATEKRTATISTPNYPPETVEWTGKALQGQTTAIVDPEDIMPRSKVAMLQFAQTAAQMGLLQDPAALGRFLRIAEIPDTRDILEALAPDVAKARRENAMMFQGRVPDPLSMDIDNHNIHIEEHHTAMKSPRWDELSPKEQDIFRKHVQAHATLSAEQLGKQVAKAEVSPVLASAADATGAPTLPVSATGPLALGGGTGAPPPGPPGPGGGGVAAAVQQQNPGIDPGVVQAGV